MTIGSTRSGSLGLIGVSSFLCERRQANSATTIRSPANKHQSSHLRKGLGRSLISVVTGEDTRLATNGIFFRMLSFDGDPAASRSSIAALSAGFPEASASYVKRTRNERVSSS